MWGARKGTWSRSGEVMTFMCTEAWRSKRLSRAQATEELTDRVGKTQRFKVEAGVRRGFAAAGRA